MVLLPMGVLDQAQVLGNVHVKMSDGVLDYGLVSSDLFPLISDFVVLDFCELYSDVHYPIFLKLNLTEAQETELGHLGQCLVFVIFFLES